MFWVYPTVSVMTAGEFGPAMADPYIWAPFLTCGR